MTTKSNGAKAGAKIHFLDATTTFGFVFNRGDEIVLTADNIEMATDKNGVSWLDDLSEDAQVARWGRVRIGLGPWPESAAKWFYGDPEWAELREQARKRAWRAFPEDRAAALAAVEEEFGPAPSTSKTLNRAPAKSLITPSRKQGR